jgi:Ca2+-binding RTX toxin-like protein
VAVCPTNAYLEPVLGPTNDIVASALTNEPVNATLGAGADALNGRSIYGEDGDDLIYGGAGADGFACGPGDDTIHIGALVEDQSHSSDCEHYVLDDPA